MGRSGYKAQPRYLEASWRNRASRIFIGGDSKCKPVPICGDVCITVKRAGDSQCNSVPQPNDNLCGQKTVSPCDLTVVTVCASEIDDSGYAIFEWPRELITAEEGWYEAHIEGGCSSCGILPLRVGPRCNVIEVENIIAGPDCKDWVTGCDDGCEEETCPTSGSNSADVVHIYKPNWRS